MLPTRQTFALAIALSLVLEVASGCRSNARPDSGAVATTPARGGELLVSARTEPRSFNRHAARDSTTGIVSTFINATLVRINRVSDTVEPLPWKGMPPFPFGSEASRPADSAYEAYLHDYQTRTAGGGAGR